MRDDLRGEASDPRTAPGRLEELLLLDPTSPLSVEPPALACAVLRNPSLPLERLADVLTAGGVRGIASLEARVFRHQAAWENPSVGLLALQQPSLFAPGGPVEHRVRFVFSGLRVLAGEATGGDPYRGMGLTEIVAHWAGRPPDRANPAWALASRIAGVLSLPWPGATP